MVQSIITGRYSVVTVCELAYAVFFFLNVPSIGPMTLDANQGVPATDKASRKGSNALTIAYAATDYTSVSQV